MKSRLFTLICCFTLLLTGCCSAGSYQSSDSSSGCGSVCNASPSPCACTDPACNGSNPCFDRASCCRVFGNIGSVDSLPVYEDYHYSRLSPDELSQFNETYAENRVEPVSEPVPVVTRVRHAYK